MEVQIKRTPFTGNWGRCAAKWEKGKNPDALLKIPVNYQKEGSDSQMMQPSRQK